MSKFTEFRGRIIQVAESLDIGDAVSNQIIALDALIRDFGIRSAVAVKWRHEDVISQCVTLDEIKPTDEDILIYHSAGFSEHACDYTLTSNCTRVLLYHNITPAEYFEESSKLYTFCKKGRNQLAETIKDFHYYWADSQYNLDELIQLGAAVDRSHVIPIIVSPPEQGRDARIVDGSWLFLGRIAGNKGQDKLVEMFHAAHKEDSSAASKLYLVGRFEENEPYYEGLKSLIEQRKLASKVVLAGKVSDEEKEVFLRQAAVMVSLSSHEGFGVPLVEAPLHGTPVVALTGTAVDETMGNGSGIARDLAEAKRLAMRAAKDGKFRDKLVSEQQANAERFRKSAVRQKLRKALKQILPKPGQFSTISVVVCTYNRRSDLERCLDYLAYQTNSSFEVIIVDGPSTDGTKELLAQWGKRIKVVHNPERNLSISRNLGADAAAGDIVAYIDDDAIPFADWTNTLLREFNQRPLTTAGVGGPAYYAGSLKFQIEDIGFNKLAETLPNAPADQIGKDGWVRSLIGTNTAFSRMHLRAIGGFDEQYDYYLDESDLTFRLQAAGSLIAYCPDLHLRHEFARSENRQGRHTFNWFSICKNTTYFIALYSGLTGDKLKEFLRMRLESERVAPLDEALATGQINEKLHSKLVSEIWRGMKQGLVDSERGTLTRTIAPQHDNFLRFQTRTDFPRVDAEIRRLHVCIISKEFPPFGPSGGIGTLYYHLASELLLLGHEVTVVMPKSPGRDGRYDQGRFHIRFVEREPVDFGERPPANAANLSWALRAAAAVAEVHKEKPVDVIDSALWDAEALAFALIDKPRPPLIVRLVTPFAVVAETNGWDISHEHADQFISAEKSLIQHADAVVGISKSICDTVTAQYGISTDRRWSVSHCGIAYWPFFDWSADYEELTGEQGIRDFVQRFPRTVLFLGRLERRKGIDTVLHAAANFLKNHRDVGLIISGQEVEGWQAKAEKILPRAMRRKVLFTGAVSDATREKLMARAYCLVFPSRYESFGLVPLEAFVHGVPVVAADAGAIPEVLSDGDSGLLFPVEDPAALAAKVNLLLDDPDLRERLSSGARLAIRQFSGRASAIRAIDLYASLTKDKSPFARESAKLRPRKSGLHRHSSAKDAEARAR